MVLPLFVYAPTLHRSLAPAALPETVAFMHPGLPGLSFRHQDVHPATYPLSPQAARACLNELLLMGANMAQAENIRHTPEDWRQETMSLPEQEALARFTAPDASAPQDGGMREAALRAAQATLLLAWDLEEKLLEIRILEEQVALGWTELHARLHGEKTILQDLGTTPPPPWQAVLAAMAAFLPAESVLVSGCEGLRLRLLEDGLPQPLPEHLAGFTSAWDAEYAAAVLWARASLWRVLGIARAPEDKPWLSRVRDILLVPAADGAGREEA